MSLVTLLTAAASLAAVVLLALGGGRILGTAPLRRLALGGQGQPLAVRSSLALDAKRRLVLFACDQRRALLLTGPHGDTFLGWIPDEARTAPHDGCAP